MPRNWDVVRDDWLAYIPELPEPGASPESSVSQLPELEVAIASLQKGATARLDHIPGLRESVFHEALFSYHKAVHILGASLLHVQSGMCTWSVVSAYQSSFIGARAVLALIGVVPVELPERGQYVVDCWNWHDTLYSRHRKKSQISVHNSGKLDHPDVWCCLKRAVESTEGLSQFCTDYMLNAITEADANDFAANRNKLIYKTDVWYFGDLHECITESTLKIHGRDVSIAAPEFSIALAIEIARLGYKMLKSISPSKVIEDELAIVDTWLSQPFNSQYHSDNSN